MAVNGVLRCLHGGAKVDQRSTFSYGRLCSALLGGATTTYDVPRCGSLFSQPYALLCICRRSRKKTWRHPKGMFLLASHNIRQSDEAMTKQVCERFCMPKGSNQLNKQ